MYTLINGSPKPRYSNSEYFLNLISNNLENFCTFDLKKGELDKIVSNIQKSNIIILAFPLYVDSPTSIVLKFLDYIYDKKINLEDKQLYVVINCGFREGSQNITALNIIKRWCDKVNISYCGSLLIGAGEIVGKKHYRFICREALKKLNHFSKVIKKGEKCDDLVTTMDILNNKIYCFLANRNWSKSGKKNNLTIEDIKIK